MIFWHMKSW